MRNSKQKRVIKPYFFIIIFLFAIVTVYCKSTNNNKTQVMILATIHGLHKKNPNYSYDNVFKIIEHFNPDIIAVEIRPEDIKESSEYLRKNYPYEMIKILSRFNKKKILGFDWLGVELEGRKIPDGWWQKHSVVKKLEREFSQDSSFILANKIMDVVIKKQVEMAKKITAAQLNDGRYDIITDIFYKQFGIITEGTKYSKLYEFYIKRDEHIDKNIINIIKNNIGKKLIFVMGANHRVFAMDKIQKEFGNSIELVPVK